jgi:hypothetical protein
MRFPQQIVGVIGVTACLALGAAAAANQAQTSGEKKTVIPDNASALEGQPAVRVDATKEGATRRQLGRDEAANHRLKISIVNGKYYWASRENRPLTLTSSGEFTYLSSTDPGQYVRFKKINDRIEYVEHVDKAFESVTFWGELRIVLMK